MKKPFDQATRANLVEQIRYWRTSRDEVKKQLAEEAKKADRYSSQLADYKSKALKAESNLENLFKEKTDLQIICSENDVLLRQCRQRAESFESINKSLSSQLEDVKYELNAETEMCIKLVTQIEKSADRITNQRFAIILIACGFLLNQIIWVCKYII